MNPRLRSRPMVEPLEDRWTPAVSATISSGTLLVTGAAITPGDTIAITQTSPGVFTVADGGVPVTISGSGAVSDLVVRLGRANDIVSIDLGGFTLAGSVSARLGGGTDSVTVANGTINGSLELAGGPGRDTMTVADGLNLDGALAVTTAGGDDTVTVGTATLGSAVFDLGGGNDKLTFNATVGAGAGSVLDIDAGSGNDTVELLASTSIQGSATIDLSYGQDTFAFDDAAILTGELLVRGGPGKDAYIGTLPRASVTATGFEA